MSPATATETAVLDAEERRSLSPSRDYTGLFSLCHLAATSSSASPKRASRSRRSASPCFTVHRQEPLPTPHSPFLLGSTGACWVRSAVAAAPPRVACPGGATRSTSAM